MPDLPNIHTAIVLALAALALVLFALEQVRLETAAILVLILLLVTFSVAPFELPDGSPYRAVDLLRAFGNTALIAVCALMVMGKGVESTRALQPMVAAISRHWHRAPLLMMLGVLVLAALLSAFLNNTPIVVVLLPALIAIADRTSTPASKLLLPAGLVTIVGGMATTIGTSTNLLVVTMSEEIAGIRFSMFDFAGYVLVAGGIGLLFLWLVAPLITPDRTRRQEPDSDREFIATLHVKAGSPLIGNTVAEFLSRIGRSLAVDQIQHCGTAFRLPLPSVTLHEGDRIFVRGSRSDLKEAEHILRAPLGTMERGHLGDPELEPGIAELLVTERSELDRHSLAEVNLASRFGIQAVALHRPRPAIRRTRQRVGHIRLRAGDILLCEGTRAQFDRLAAQTHLLILGEPVDLPVTRRGPVALAIVALVVASAAVGLLPIAVGALAGVLLMILTRCLSWRQIGEALSARVILIIVVSLTIGSALITTGGDAYLAATFIAMLAGAGPAATVTALMFFMAILTNVVSNNAAAVIGTPVALQIALQIGVSPEPLILAVLFGANLSFATPIGYQTNLLVMSAGAYRFSDFLRVGGPLTIIMWLVLSWMLARNYGLS